MMRWKFLLMAMVTVAVAGCLRLPEPEQYLQEKIESLPAERHFTVCHGYDCTFRSALSLEKGEWNDIRALFEPMPPTPAAERRTIAQAIALIERFVGARIGTDKDIAGFAHLTSGDPTQQDCIDESTNTTTYLTMLVEDSLLHHHAVAAPAGRGVFFDFRWYHQSAVIAEIGSGTEYAVDSWYNANGQVPLIAELSLWKAAYDRPKEADKES